MANPPTAVLESVPTEIKLGILNSMPDVKSLRALVHASPLYHATYFLARDQVFTNATLLELQSRKINVTTRVDYAEICVRGGGGMNTPDAVLETAVQDIFNQLDRNASIKLTLHQCIALLTLEDFKGFCIEYRADLGPQEPIPSQQWFSWDYKFTCVTHSDPTQYLPEYGWRNYKVISFGPENETVRFWLGEQLKYCHKRYGWREAGLKTRQATAVRRAEKKRLVEEARRAEKKRLLEEEKELEKERRQREADERRALKELILCGAMMAIAGGVAPISKALIDAMKGRLGYEVRLRF